MRIYTERSSLVNNKVDAIVEHKDKKLSFMISGIYRNSVVYDYDIFEFINDYWQTLPEPIQDEIFLLYSKAKEYYNTIVNKSQINFKINEIIIKLIDLQPFEDVYDWVIYKSKIIIPDNFEIEYKYDYDKQGSREQTYIRSDYTKLVTMIVILKSLIPIWGQYLNSEQTPVKSIFKEFYAFQLLHGSKLYSSEPMEKLFIYIKAAIASNQENTSSIIQGISSEDYPYWLLASVIINRLCDGDIRGIDPKANIVTYIYKFIFQKSQSFESNNSRTIKEKTKTDYDGDQGDKNSALERYKIKHDISVGEIVELTYSIRDLKHIAYRLSHQNMTDELFYASQKSAQKLLMHEIQISQVNLLRWVFKSVISPKGILYLDKHVIVNCLGVLQSVLYSLNYGFLSLFSTAYVQTQNDEFYLSSTDSRARIPKELLARLDEIYPYQQATNSSKTAPKLINPAVQAIDQLVDNMSKHSWICTADEHMVEKVNGLKENIRLTIPYDIKIQLAQLVIDFSKRF